MSGSESNSGRSPLDVLSYPRSILFTIFGLILTLAMCFIVLFTVFAIRSKRVLDWMIVYLWSLPLIKPAGVKVEVRGEDLVRRTGQGVLILFNHSSLWDIPVLYAYFPRPFRFGAKVELFKIPFFGRAMKASGVLPIDRASRSKVMKIYSEAVSRIDNGESFALAPEGTRQGGEELGRFKRGPFEFAINAQAEIVPVIIAGALKVLPKHSIWVNMGRWRRRVILQILPPVPASQYTMETADDLQERVREQMAAAFTRLNKEINQKPY